MPSIKYPRITDRVKGAFADGLVLIGLMVIVSSVFSSIEDVSDEARKVAFVVIFFVYDPLLTSLLGGTLGHLMVGIRVKQESDIEKNIPIYFAVLRFAIKASLGWISLLTVTGNEQRKAIHYMAAKSLVVYNK